MSNTSPGLEAVTSAARPIVERVVWCTVASVSPQHAPRTRLMHPVWFWHDEQPVALVSARPTPLKVRHLDANPEVSCFYWDPAHDTVAIDATARWVDPDDRERAWRRIAEIPPPVGFDPTMIWPEGPTSVDCAFLHLDAHRIVVRPAGRPGLVWRRPATEPSVV